MAQVVGFSRAEDERLAVEFATNDARLHLPHDHCVFGESGEQLCRLVDSLCEVVKSEGFMCSTPFAGVNLPQRYLYPLRSANGVGTSWGYGPQASFWLQAGAALPARADDTLRAGRAQPAPGAARALRAVSSLLLWWSRGFCAGASAAAAGARCGWLRRRQRIYRERRARSGRAARSVEGLRVRLVQAKLL